MATWPATGTPAWDTPLKAYIDTFAPVEGRPINLHDEGVSPANSAATNTAALQAACDAAPAGSRLFLPVAATPVAINDGILVEKRLTLAGLGGKAAIQQTVWGKPVFDVLNADDVTIEDFAFTNAAARDATIPGTVRDGAAKTYAAGVWAAADRLTVRRVTADGFTSCVRLTNWDDVSQAADGFASDCLFEDIAVSDVDWGIHGKGIQRATFRNVSGSYSLSPGSADPAHLLYLSEAELNEDITVDTCEAFDGTGGHAFQFKGVDGLQGKTLRARNCPGILSIRQVQHVSLEDLQSLADVIATDGSLYIQGEGGEQAIRIRGVYLDMTTAPNVRAVRVDGTDGLIADALIETAHTVRADSFVVEVNGTRNTLENVACHNSTATGRGGIRLATGSGHVLRNPVSRGNWFGVSVTSGVTDCVVEHDPSRFTSDTTSGYRVVRVSEPTTIARPKSRRSVYTTGAGQEVRVRVDEATVAAVNVTGTTAFTVNVPIEPYTNARLEYLVTDNSGSAMGTVTWNAAHTLATAWANPAAGATRSITFAYDGTVWREVARSG